MHKPIHLLVASCCALISYAQKTDSLIIFYRPDQFSISKPDQQRLDSFLLHGWDRVTINGYTDETEEEDYNLELSKKRSGEVFRYLAAKNIDRNAVSTRYFGETMPAADNSSDNGRALNRRTMIIGYRYARIKPKPVEDPMKSVTKTLDNGFIITYRPGSLPDYMAANFESGSGMDFQLITNTVEMRQNNLFNNTTRGEILSSVLIICGERLNPCKLDSPILIKVPIPFKTKCPIEKVKFFNAVAERGKRIWQEETKQLYPEMIGGQQYIRIWMDNFCECINFDFKVDPDCFDTDSTRLLLADAGIKNLTAELKGLNSVYMPRKVNDSTHSLLFLKDKLNGLAISFALYNGRRRIKGFGNQLLSAFPYDSAAHRYILSTGTQKIYFPRLKVYNVVLKVNKDKYRIAPERNKYEFVYLNRKTETILVDFSIEGPRGRVTEYANLPLESLLYDKEKEYYVIDKKFLKELKEKTAIAKR
ncbi:MAG TPA: OmpA family protein [Chitinophagaceae bacterium]